ncbi:MAG: aminoglycoside phosphotransferase family protein [Actinomycetota bacterium]|nr:aminoglycoside phosphotransferase family protein [Actinomycetota bacterium]
MSQAHEALGEFLSDTTMSAAEIGPTRWCSSPVSPLDIPPLLARNVVDAWGADGEQWLAELPHHIDGVRHQWELELGAPFKLSYHWVVAARRTDGTPAVLKLGVPGSDHLRRQAAALLAFDGCGAVRLIEYDPERGALLLERAEPGDMAAELVPQHDGDATAAAIAVTRRLHVDPPPGCALPDLETEGRSFADHLCKFPGDEPLPRHLVERAARLFDGLCATATRRVVLHGDLHHDNLLRATREPWLAIDPHGYLGDPGYDVGALLYNPDPDRRDDALLDLVPARIEQLAAGLDMTSDRVTAWGFVMAVLSEVWTCQDDGPPAGRPLDVAVQLLPRVH